MMCAMLGSAGLYVITKGVVFSPYNGFVFKCVSARNVVFGS